MDLVRGELHSDDNGNELDANNSFLFGCPYLGTLEDMDTSLSFPAVANHCFRTKSPSTVDLPHQEAYCLTDKHPGCHVFQQEIASPIIIGPTKKIKKTERSNRRLSIFAFPLILILLFLAAIIWWPAPGTNLQEAIAFGSQLQESIGSSTAVLNNPNTDNEPEQIAAVVPAEITGEDQATDGNKKEATSLTEKSEQEEAAQPKKADQGETASIEPEPAIEQSSPEEAEPLLEDTSPADVQETSPVKAVEESKPESAAAHEEDPAEAQENITAAPAEEIKETVEFQETVDIKDTTAAVKEAASVETEIEEEEETASLIIYDLPVISDQLSALNIALDQPAGTSPDGERVALIGPDAGTPLALRDASNSARALFVRKNPNLESELLTIINRRQQVSILGRDNSSTWFKVRLDTGVEGWVNAVQSQAGIDPSSVPLSGDPSTSVTAPLPVSTITAFPVIRTAVVDTGALNVRSGPGVGYESVTTIDSGETVGLLGRRGLGVWVRVRLDNGLEGWVNSSLLAPLR